MSSSIFCIEQRQKEKQQARKWLVWGLVGSAVLHSSIALAMGIFYEKSTLTDEPIELMIVEKPEPSPPEPVIAKEKSKPKHLVTPPPPLKKLPQASPQAIPTPIPQTKTEKIQPIKNQLPAPAKSSSPRSVASPTQSRAKVTPRSSSPQISPQLSSSEQRKPLLTTSAPSTTTVSDSDENTSNPLAPSTSPRINGAVQPLSGNDNSQGRGQLRASFGGTSRGGEDGVPGGVPRGTTESVAASRGTPPRPKPQPQQPARQQGISCISHCQPSYPSVLNGAEGNASVQVALDASGNVVSATLIGVHSNSQLNREALLAARKMKFTASPDGQRASVKITVNFTVAGSEFDRKARDRREQQERVRLAREREKKEQQAQLEKERQERQRQLQQEQRERQAQLEKERQERQRQEQERQSQLERERQEQLEQQALPGQKPLLPTSEPSEDLETNN